MDFLVIEDVLVGNQHLSMLLYFNIFLIQNDNLDPIFSLKSVHLDYIFHISSLPADAILILDYGLVHY